MKRRRKKRRQERYSFAVCLAVSMILGVAGWASGVIQKEDGKIALHVPMLIDQVQAEEEHPSGNPDPEGAEAVTAEEETDEKEENASSEETETGTETKEEAGAEEDEKSEEGKVWEPVIGTADLSYFDNALFIGDSRTVGLREYGNLGNAEVVADSGMNVYKIFEKEFVTVSGEKKQLETILLERQFGKIYLMLGINELGYDFERTVSRYAELLTRIRELQPEAIVFLEANLHITGKKSEESPIYTNENINRFNQAVKQMADGQCVFWLDVNELFDDRDGNLAEEYTVDHAHVLGKYYIDWVDWILEHAVVFDAGADT